MKRRSAGYKTLGVLVLVLLVALAGARRLGEMDRRFFDPSLPTLRGLAHYLAGDYGGAARWYRSSAAREIRPGPPTSWLVLVAGNHAAAETLAQAELTRQPEAVAPRLTLAEVALARGQYEAALAEAGRALALQADDYDALLLTTLARARRGHWNEAIDALKQALRQDRTEQRSSVFLSMLQLTGDLDDLDAPPLALLSHLHRYLRIYDDAHARLAVRYAERAIEARDRADDAWVTVGLVRDRQGRRRGALEAFDRAVALNPANTAALLGAARLRADRGELDAEYRLLRAAFQVTPDDPFVVERLHFTLTRKLGDYRQALTLEQAVVAARPDDAKAWWRLGAVQLYLGDHGGALRSFDRSVQVGALAEAHEGRGHALHELGRNEEAAAAFQRAIQIDPARSSAYLGLARLQARERRYGEALRAYERAYEHGARQVEQVVELCALYYETGQVDVALGCLRDVLARDPDNVRGRALLEHVRATAARRPA